MNKDKKYINPIFPDISVEDFDELGKHKFSKEYKRNKRQMLREYHRRKRAASRSTYAKIAVAACLLIVSVPIVVQAATNGVFFQRIWGNLTRQNVEQHEEVLLDEQELPYTYTFPKREYVGVDAERARKLVGGHVLSDPIERQIGDTKLTILSRVCDESAAVVEFKLEREGGVNAFEYSQLDNEFRGALFSDKPTFWFEFVAGSENIIVDLERSTDDVVYCYDYMALEPDAYDKEKKGLLFEVTEYPCTRKEMFEADEKAFEAYQKNTIVDRILVPFQEPVAATKFVNADGGAVSLSPLALDIDMQKGLGLSEEEIYDYENVYYAAIHYKDQTTFVVREHEQKGRHSCEEKVDNTCCVSSNEQGHAVMAFNRLVDPDEIESITVNDTTYSRK